MIKLKPIYSNRQWKDKQGRIVKQRRCIKCSKFLSKKQILFCRTHYIENQYLLSKEWKLFNYKTNIDYKNKVLIQCRNSRKKCVDTQTLITYVKVYNDKILRDVCNVPVPVNIISSLYRCKI